MKIVLLPVSLLVILVFLGCDFFGINSGKQESPDGWTVKEEAGTLTRFDSMNDALSFANNLDNYRSILSYNGKELFATGALLQAANTNIPDDPVAAVPLYDDLDLAYKAYYKKNSANSFTTIGPGGRGWHITYAYPLDVVEHEYTNKDNFWYKTDWPTENPDIPLEQELFVKVGLDGKRDLYIHSDFVKEIIFLKDASDLHHVTAQSNTRAQKGGGESSYKEMVRITLWGEDMPDGTETHPDGAQPAEFKIKPDTAVYKNDGVPLCLAPVWMEEGTKYYSFDNRYFYLDTDDMYRDIYEDAHGRAFNNNDEFINIYSHLNVFKSGAYTVDELYEYIDHRIGESQGSKSEDELSLLSPYLPLDYPFGNIDWPSSNPYPSQKETFRDLATDSGFEINLAVMVAVSEAESGFGRSIESHDDGDPFNHGTYWKSNDLSGQTDKIIQEWPLYWKDEVDAGKKLPMIGLKGGGIAQGYNPGMSWGPHVAGKIYELDLYLGFKERDRIDGLADPFGDEFLIEIAP
jgi:hypothetical protein